jgi:hypothetical protein
VSHSFYIDLISFFAVVGVDMPSDCGGHVTDAASASFFSSSDSTDILRSVFGHRGRPLTGYGSGARAVAVGDNLQPISRNNVRVQSMPRTTSVHFFFVSSSFYYYRTSSPGASVNKNT